jgi:hypothetical protein
MGIGGAPKHLSNTACWLLPLRSSLTWHVCWAAGLAISYVTAMSGLQATHDYTWSRTLRAEQRELMASPPFNYGVDHHKPAPSSARQVQLCFSWGLVWCIVLTICFAAGCYSICSKGSLDEELLQWKSVLSWRCKVGNCCHYGPLLCGSVAGVAALTLRLVSSKGASHSLSKWHSLHAAAPPYQ